MLIAFEPMPIEAAKPSTAWAVPDVCLIQLDLIGAYQGKKTREGNNLKTVFRTRNGRLEYQTMRLPAAFQAYSYNKGPGQAHRGVASIKIRTDF